MVRIRSVVNGNVVEESEDQAAFLVGAGLFVYLDPPAVDEPEPEPPGPPRPRHPRKRA